MEVDGGDKITLACTLHQRFIICLGIEKGQNDNDDLSQDS